MSVYLEPDATHEQLAKFSSMTRKGFVKSFKVFQTMNRSEKRQKFEKYVYPYLPSYAKNSDSVKETKKKSKGLVIHHNGGSYRVENRRNFMLKSVEESGAMFTLLSAAGADINEELTYYAPKDHTAIAHKKTNLAKEGHRRFLNAGAIIIIKDSEMNHVIDLTELCLTFGPSISGLIAAICYTKEFGNFLIVNVYIKNHPAAFVRNQLKNFFQFIQFAKYLCRRLKLKLILSGDFNTRIINWQQNRLREGLSKSNRQYRVSKQKN